MARLGRSQPFKPLVRPFRLLENVIFPSSTDDGNLFGDATLVLDVAPSAITSGEAFGTTTVAATTDLSIDNPPGIASAEASGTGIIVLDIMPAGIASGEQFDGLVIGSGSVIAGSGIGSAEAFGTTTLTNDVAPTGIGSAEAFGGTVVGDNVVPSGIASSEALGAVSISPIITLTGIPSGEVFGSHFVGASQIIAPVGIVSGEVFGDSFPAGNLKLFDIPPPLPPLPPRIDLPPAQVPVLENQLIREARAALSAADFAAAAELAAPTDILVTFYDKVYTVRDECNDYLSLQVAFPRHLVETGTVVMKSDDPMAPFALMCHEEVVPVTVEIGHMVWSGRVKVAKDRFGWPGEGDTVVCELEGDRAWLMKIMAWPSFLLPIQVQFPPRGVAIGPAISVIRWLIATQAFRLQAGLWDLINNLGSLNLDWRSWFGTFLMADITGADGRFDFADIMRILRTPIYVCKTNLTGAIQGILTDTSPFISINWRMDKIYDLVDQIVKDNGLVVEVNLWRPGDPQPDEGMIFPLTVPTIVVDVKDRMGIVGPTGTFFDGILRTLVDLQDSIFGEITQPFLNPGGESFPEGFNIAPLLGLHWVPPWAIFNADHPKAGVWGEIAHHHPLAWRTIIGGKSPKWLNDLMNAFFSWMLDSLMIIIGLTGLPSNLLDGLFNDILLAFALSDNMTRRIKLGPYGYPEWFAPTANSPYNIDGIFAMKREQWVTRGYVAAIVNFNNGYPYEIGRDLFRGALASVIKRGKVYTDFVENIVVSDSRDECKVEVQIGDGIAEEPAVVKTYRNIVKIQEALNILTLSSSA